MDEEKVSLDWVESPESSPITWVHGFHPETGALVVSFDCDPYEALWKIKLFNIFDLANGAQNYSPNVQISKAALGCPYRDAASCRAAWEAYVEMQDKMYREHQQREAQRQRDMR